MRASTSWRLGIRVMRPFRGVLVVGQFQEVRDADRCSSGASRGPASGCASRVFTLIMSPGLTSMLGMSHLLAVDRDVAVGDHLAGRRPVDGEPEPVDDVIQPALQDREQLLAGVADGPGGELEVAAELALQHAVEPLELLLLAEADAVLGRSCCGGRPCMPGGGVSRSIGHFGLKQPLPLRYSFICSRRHSLQTGSVLRAMCGCGIRCQGSVGRAYCRVPSVRGRCPLE